MIPKDRRLIGVVVRQDQDRKLRYEAKSAGKTRSTVVQDAIDRYFSDVPDIIDVSPPGLNQKK